MRAVKTKPVVITLTYLPEDKVDREYYMNDIYRVLAAKLGSTLEIGHQYVDQEFQAMPPLRLQTIGITSKDSYTIGD